MKYEKNVKLQNCSFQLDLQMLSDIVSDKMYIFGFNFEKYNWNSKIAFFKQYMWDTKKPLNGKSFAWMKSSNSHPDLF